MYFLKILYWVNTLNQHRKSQYALQVIFMIAVATRQFKKVYVESSYVVLKLTHHIYLVIDYSLNSINLNNKELIFNPT